MQTSSVIVDKLAMSMPMWLIVTLKEARQQERCVSRLAGKSPQVALLLESAQAREGLNR